MQKSRQHWPIFSQVLRQESLMNRMIAALKINMLDAVRQDRGEAIASARDKCFHCTNIEACKSWLNTAQDPKTPPIFCPNSTFLHRLRPTRLTQEELKNRNVSVGIR